MNLKATKSRKKLCASLLLGMAACLSPTLQAQEQFEKEQEPKTKQEYKPGYWYIGAEFFSPMYYDDLYSWRKGGKFNFGTGVQLKGGYMFSSVFGLELNAGMGRNYMNTSPFQKDYVLGIYDAYTYYPYTLINGTQYTHYAPDVVGEQGNNPQAVQIEGVPFHRIRSKASVLQFSVNAAVNVTRLFYTQRYTEKPVELWLKPGIYLSKFKSKVYDTQSGKVTAPNVNRSRTWGLGGDAVLQFNLSPRWAAYLTSRIIWERDHSIDGVLNIKKAHDSYVWEPGVGLAYKFRRKVPAQPVETPVAPKPALILDLDFWYPDMPALPQAKPRTHSASVYLTYILNKTYISPELHNNPIELARLNKELQSIAGNPDYSIRKILVEGFASPEGPYDNNMRLAEGRARSIIDYIVAHSNIERGLFTVGRMSENWDGLKDTLNSNPSIPGRDKFLRLIERTPNTELLKTEIKKIPEYTDLLADVYPHLRRSSYTVEYDVRSYRGEEAKEIIRHSPQLLSAEEIYSVACYYGLGTEEADKAINVLNQLYPDADITIAYNGIKALNANDPDRAVTLLSTVKRPDASVLNALGVAYAYQGNRAQAERFFKMASNNKDAQRNLRKLTRRD